VWPKRKLLQHLRWTIEITPSNLWLYYLLKCSKADVGSKVKGLDWRLLLLLPVIVAGCFFGFRWFGGLWVRSVLPAVKKQAAVSNVHTVPDAVPPQVLPASPVVPSAPPKISVEKGLENNSGDTSSNEALMIGWVLEGGKTQVALSDDRLVGQEDGLTQITRSYCIIQGRIYRMRSRDEQLRDEQRSAARHSSESRPR